MRRIQSASLVLLFSTASLAACSPDHSGFPDYCNVSLGSVAPYPANVGVGDTVRLVATLNAGPCLPADATPSQLRWSSSDTLVARVDPESGVVTGRAPGSAVVTVRTATTQTFITEGSVVVR